MANTKQPRRPHYIQDWAEHRGYNTQSALATALEADKGLVNRWYKGSSPGIDWQIKLSHLFSCEPESLFRHPDDDWISRFFKDREKEEIERMKALLEAAFPKTGTNG